VTVVQEVHAPPEVARRRSLAARTVRQPRAYISLGWLVLLALASIVVPLLGVLSPLTQNVSEILALPSAHHLLGTDEVGRDILARIVWGARDALLLSAEVVAISVVIGAPLGLWAGFGSKPGDWIASRLAELTLAIPGMIVLLAVVTIDGNNLPIAMAVLGFLLSAGNIRLARASTKAVTRELYFDAARVSGLSPRRIAVRHVFPNIAGPLIVQASLIGGIALLTVTGLQFLGLGPNPPTPSWGGLVSEASNDLYRQSWMMVPIGLVIILTVLAFYQFGDALRDQLGGPGRVSLLRAAPNLALGGRRSQPRAGTPPVPDHADRTHTTDAALIVRGLTVTARRAGRSVKLVDDVSFRVAKGETLGIVGESGCGKSMTALAVLGLLPSNVAFEAGCVLAGGRDLATLTDRQRRPGRGRRIGAISQEPMAALDPNFTIGNQLVAPIRRLQGVSRSAARTEAVRLLNEVGIASPEEIYRRYPHELSGGMTQRVCIAQALIGNPDILIADEPTTALDVTVQAEILDLLRGLQSEMGMAIILVTHDLGVVADLCDRAIVMYAGQVVEQATAQALLRTPRHPYTLSLLNSVPSAARRGKDLPAIEGAAPAPEEWSVSCRFADRCPLAVNACRRESIPISRSEMGTLSRCIRADEVERLPRLPAADENGALAR
jgi:peptide/nickel transport system permease protein